MWAAQLVYAETFHMNREKVGQVKVRWWMRWQEWQHARNSRLACEKKSRSDNWVEDLTAEEKSLVLWAERDA